MEVESRLARLIADAIAERREESDDPDLAQLRDGSFDVLAHVARHQRVPAEVLHDDVLEGFALARALRALLDRYEAALFDAAPTAGVSLNDAARALGMAGKQAAYAYRKSLRARVRVHDQAAAGVEREEAERVAAAAARRPTLTPERVRELALALATMTLTQAPDLEDDVSDVQGDLERWRPGRPVPPELVDDLRLLLFELRERRARLSGELAEVVDRGVGLFLLSR